MHKKIAGFLYKSKKYYHHISAQGFSYRSLFSKCIVLCKSQFRYYLLFQKLQRILLNSVEDKIKKENYRSLTTRCEEKHY